MKKAHSGNLPNINNAKCKGDCCSCCIGRQNFFGDCDLACFYYWAVFAMRRALLSDGPVMRHIE